MANNCAHCLEIWRGPKVERLVYFGSCNIEVLFDGYFGGFKAFHDIATHGIR